MRGFVFQPRQRARIAVKRDQEGIVLQRHLASQNRQAGQNGNAKKHGRNSREEWEFYLHGIYLWNRHG
jgi:hypothetical protein